MQFKYAKSQEEIYKIEYLQDIEVKSKIPLKNQLDILVILEEIGGWLLYTHHFTVKKDNSLSKLLPIRI